MANLVDLSEIHGSMFPGCCGARVIYGFNGTNPAQRYPTGMNGHLVPQATFATLVEGAQDEYIEALLEQGWWKVMRWPGQHQEEAGKRYWVCLMVKGPRIEMLVPGPEGE